MELNQKEKMISKERVLTTFNRQKPDRVPINYFGNEGINSRLIKHFGLKKDDMEGLLAALCVDFRGVDVPYIGPKIHNDVPGRHVNPQWGIHTRWIEHESGGYWDFCDFPLKDADEQEVEAWPMPSPDNYDYNNILNFCKHNERFALYVGNPGLVDIINSTGMLRSMEQVLVDLATDDPVGLRLIDRKLDVQLEVTRRSIEAAKGKIDFIWIGEDLGTQNSPMISLELFRKHILPRHQKFIDIAKEYNLPVMIHSCGSSSWAFNDFVDMGIKVVDTLQPEAKDMSPSYLKKTFGDRLVFHGCISTAGPVAYGTVENVIDNVKETLEIMMPGGGYCFSPTHMLQDNSPTENVLAMYEAIHRYGRYY